METGKTSAKGYLHKLLKNPFNVGFCQWGDTTYKGTYPLFVDPGMFQRVQEIFAAYNRPNHRKHESAFAGGLLRSAYDDCLVTAEIKKQSVCLLPLHQRTRKMRPAVFSRRGSVSAFSQNSLTESPST